MSPAYYQVSCRDQIQGPHSELDPPKALLVGTLKQRSHFNSLWRYSQVIQIKMLFFMFRCESLFTWRPARCASLGAHLFSRTSVPVI